MKISVIIPAYNEARYLAQCLSSVVNHAGPISEVVVIDNASTDNTAEIARSFPGVKVVTEPRRSLLWARQKGFLTSSGDLLAYLDADCRMPPSWAHIVRREFAMNRDIVALSGPARYYDLPPLRNFLARASWLSAPIAYRAVGYTIWGGNFVVSRHALERVGGFNTSLSFYGEDTDIARRLSAIGKVKFDMDFFAFTSGRRIMKAGLLRTFYIYGINFVWEVVRKRPFTSEYENFR